VIKGVYMPISPKYRNHGGKAKGMAKNKSKQINKLTKKLTGIKVSVENRDRLRIEAAQKKVRMQDLSDQILEEHFDAEANS
jgi:hypothetical protein